MVDFKNPPNGILTEIIFCGGTSIFPFNFKAEEISLFSSFPNSILALLNCASVSETLVSIVVCIVSFSCIFSPPQDDNTKVPIIKMIMFFISFFLFSD